jgi:WD40 repeat protein
MIYNIDPYNIFYSSDQSGGCSIVESIETIVITVGNGVSGNNSKRVAQIINIEQSTNPSEVGKLYFETPILAIKANKKRLIFVLEEEIHIYSTEELSFFTKISTVSNPKGVCALSAGAELYPMLLAYPSSRGSGRGDLILYDPLSLEKSRTIIDVHDHPLRFINFSSDGKLVATASHSGTLIKILPISEKENERYVFRRGILHSADITSIAFNKSSKYLAVSSLNGTVHIFNISDGLEKYNSSKSVMQSVGDALWGEETRSFLTVKCTPGLNNHIAFSSDSSRLFTVTEDGKFSQWQLDKNKTSGWTSTVPVCKLVREENLLNFYDDIPDRKKVDTSV